MALLQANGLKQCPRCKVEKPASEFYRDRQPNDGLCVYCKPCKNRQNTDNRDLDPQRFEAMQRDRSRRHRRRKEYGLSDAEFAVLVEQCESTCQICGKPVQDEAEAHGDRLVVDHDHATGLVRGILCDPCNNGLGRFRDDPALLVAAANYLLKGGESDPR